MTKKSQRLQISYKVYLTLFFAARQAPKSEQTVYHGTPEGGYFVVFSKKGGIETHFVVRLDDPPKFWRIIYGF